MRRILAKICYNLSWLVCRPVFGILFGFRVKNREKLKNLKPPLLIVANHVSFFDPFLIGAAFPFGSKIFPIRFATAPRYYKSPLLFPFIWCYGSFPIYKKIGLENSLRIPLVILKKGGVVGIFPEGKVRRLGRPRKGRRGAAYLALKTGIPILPMRIEGILNLKRKFFQSKTDITIIAGDIFNLPVRFSRSEHLNQAAEIIMEKSQRLKRKE